MDHDQVRMLHISISIHRYVVFNTLSTCHNIFDKIDMAFVLEPYTEVMRRQYGRCMILAFDMMLGELVTQRHRLNRRIKHLVGTSIQLRYRFRDKQTMGHGEHNLGGARTYVCI